MRERGDENKGKKWERERERSQCTQRRVIISALRGRQLDTTLFCSIWLCATQHATTSVNQLIPCFKKNQKTMHVINMTVWLPTELCICCTAWYTMDIPLLWSNSYLASIRENMVSHQLYRRFRHYKLWSSSWLFVLAYFAFHLFSHSDFYMKWTSSLVHVSLTQKSTTPPPKVISLLGSYKCFIL